jgi:hypothetical protein
LLLAVIMGVAAFMLCGFCAGGTLVGLQVLTYKPSPVATATAFWQDVEQQNYSLITSSLLSPTLRVEYNVPTQFEEMAQQSDHYYGLVTNFTLLSEGGDLTQTATLTYSVTRGTNKVYKATLGLVLYSGTWGVNDLGSSLDPSENNSLPPPPTPSPSPTQLPTATPTGGASSGRSPTGPPGSVA